eukprot:m.65593 g.65593  ORF g.65593 m.65593 type:complete len:529 (+) comp8157_c0_seq2:107-1693(+)
MEEGVPVNETLSLDSDVALPPKPGQFFTFCLICVASFVIGKKLRDLLEFPLVTGYLITGIFCGPYVLEMLKVAEVTNLAFVFDVCLAYIAFSAGAEIYLPEIKPLISSIAKISILQTIAFMILGVMATYFFASQTGFMASLDSKQRIGVSLMTAVIMIARSPSSCIAIINELEAKGPFVQTVLGVTIISDIVVLVLFAVTFGITKVFFDPEAVLSGEFVAILVGEVFLSFIIGYLLGKILKRILKADGATLEEFVKKRFKYIHSNWWMPYARGRAPLFRGIAMLVFGYLVFYVAELLHIHIDLGLETLLTCMTGGYFVVNTPKVSVGPHLYLNFRHRMHLALDTIGALIYVAFFTLIGVGLNISIIPDVFGVALYFFFIRLLIMYIGSAIGGYWGKNPSKHNHNSYLTYVTQAGVALALTESVKQEFLTFGEDYATTIIAVIVIGQILGPMMFKFAVRRIGEANEDRPSKGGDRGKAPQFSLHVWWWDGEDEESIDDEAHRVFIDDAERIEEADLASIDDITASIPVS